MERKIIVIMATLVVVAVLVVAFVMVAAGGGIRRSGGFTALFDKLEYNGNETYGRQHLQAPESWHVNDIKVVSDTIVDMTYYKQTISQTSVYITTMWFVYDGTKWSHPYQGQGDNFYVPDNSHDGWMEVTHGMFSITVSSATNLSTHNSIGDVISLETVLERNGNNQIAFGDWSPKNVI